MNTTDQLKLQLQQLSEEEQKLIMIQLKKLMEPTTPFLDSSPLPTQMNSPRNNNTNYNTNNNNNRSNPSSTSTAVHTAHTPNSTTTATTTTTESINGDVSNRHSARSFLTSLFEMGRGGCQQQQQYSNERRNQKSNNNHFLLRSNDEQRRTEQFNNKNNIHHHHQPHHQQQISEQSMSLDSAINPPSPAYIEQRMKFIQDRIKVFSREINEHSQRYKHLLDNDEKESTSPKTRNSPLKPMLETMNETLDPKLLNSPQSRTAESSHTEQSHSRSHYYDSIDHMKTGNEEQKEQDQNHQNKESNVIRFTRKISPNQARAHTAIDKRESSSDDTIDEVSPLTLWNTQTTLPLSNNASFASEDVSEYQQIRSTVPVPSEKPDSPPCSSSTNFVENDGDDNESSSNASRSMEDLLLPHHPIRSNDRINSTHYCEALVPAELEELIEKKMEMMRLELSKELESLRQQQKMKLSLQQRFSPQSSHKDKRKDQRENPTDEEIKWMKEMIEYLKEENSFLKDTIVVKDQEILNMRDSVSRLSDEAIASKKSVQMLTEEVNYFKVLVSQSMISERLNQPRSPPEDSATLKNSLKLEHILSQIPASHESLTKGPQSVINISDIINNMNSLDKSLSSRKKWTGHVEEEQVEGEPLDDDPSSDPITANHNTDHEDLVVRDLELEEEQQYRSRSETKESQQPKQSFNSRSKTPTRRTKTPTRSITPLRSSINSQKPEETKNASSSMDHMAERLLRSLRGPPARETNAPEIDRMVSELKAEFLQELNIDLPLKKMADCIYLLGAADPFRRKLHLNVITTPFGRQLVIRLGGGYRDLSEFLLQSVSKLSIDHRKSNQTSK